MNNQVLNIKQMAECAETINSDITPIDKEKIKENLVTKNHDGSYKTSILYISPETLLSNRDIKVLIGDRKIGLVVIDEAHIVSTWGKSFRPDYWFLGEYLKQLRKDQAFPIAAFTATAVYGGKDDMYYDIIESLFLNVSTLYLGSVKRNNILFEIENFKKVNDYDVEKAKKVVDEAIYSIKNDKKTLIYFPFKNTLERTKRQTEQELTEKKHILKTAIYMGGNSLNAIAKQQAVEDFISGKVTTMFATKAFGMGIDIEDIERVYHFAPTGNLSDYVQEIGRVARKESIQGVAKTDFYEEDFRYIKQLFGLSSIKQFEVSEVARKILDIYSKEKKRNFLVSPEAFSYIFGSVDYDEVETRLKSILLVIKKDLETTNGLFPFSLVFRPRTMFTEGLFLIEDEDLEKIRKIGWQKYIKKSVNQEQLENISLIYYKGNVQQIKNKFLGSLYELDFKKLWEENYRDLSFGQFKHNFYSNTLVDSKYHPLNIENIFKPKIMIDLAAKENFNFDDIGKKLNEYLLGFEKALNYFKTNDKHFDLKDFSEKMIDLFPLYRNKFKQMELIVSSLINIFNNTLQPVQAQFAQNNFLQFNNNTNKYSVKNTYYKSRISLIKRNVFSNFNNSRDREKRFIISAKPAGQKSKNNVDYKVIIAQICELFDLVSYKIKAGDNAQFFMRVNSERSLQAIARGEINSKTIELVKDRHENSIKWMKYFFTKLKTNEERWDKIQSYFLGHDLEE
jgi:ATP-dependent DNA helicase RecQ